jgi:hypothetical protein
MYTDKQTINYATKNIREFTPDDTLYIRLMKNGYDYHYLCHFIKFERGMVYGKAISVDRDYGGTHFPIEVKTRLKNCYLWGKNPNDKSDWTRCHWFTQDGTVK